MGAIEMLTVFGAGYLVGRAHEAFLIWRWERAQQAAAPRAEPRREE